MDQKPERIIEFERLNLLGKAVYAGGAAVRFAANAIDVAIDRAADVISDAERAFRDGKNPQIDDARVVDEEVRPPAKRYEKQ